MTDIFEIRNFTAEEVCNVFAIPLSQLTRSPVRPSSLADFPAPNG